MRYVELAVAEMIAIAESYEQRAKDSQDFSYKDHMYQYANGLRKAVAMLELSKQIVGDED